MNGRRRAPGMWVIVLPMLVSGIALAAEPAAEAEQPLELDEILVEGRKPLRDAQQILNWMARLVGRFVVDGSVNLYGSSGSKTSQRVQGRTDCTGFGPGPAVYCVLKIRWPQALGPEGEALLGGVSNLNPASLMFGFEPNRIGIRYMLVDSAGIADAAQGYLLTGDTLVSRTKCVNVPGNCQRVVQITAEPDLKEVEMKIDLEVEASRAVSFRFVLHRVPGSPAVVMPGTSRPRK